MIKGEPIQQRDQVFRPEVNYRKLTALNCSMIKLFDTDPVKFFEQYKLGKVSKEKSGLALQIGDIVDFYLLDCRGDDDEFNTRFDEKFALAEHKSGGGQVYELAKILFEETVLDMDPETNEVKTSFDIRFSRAYENVQRLGYYKNKSEDKVLEDFNEKGYDHYQTLVDNIGKKVVEIYTLEKAKKVAELLKNDEFTKDVFCDCNEDLEYVPKFPIEWMYKEMKCKSELDILVIDHAKKTIYPKDLKTTYDNESFEIGYLKHKYYLQAAFYHLATQYWAKENNLEEYTVMPMEFIVGDTSSNNRRPVRFQLSETDLKAGLEGWGDIRGIHDLLSDITWAEKNDVWNTSRDVYENKGRMKLNIKYN